MPQITTPTSWRFDRHIGSLAAFVLGFFYLVGSMARATSDPEGGGGIIGGLVMMLGALAYMSAKRRKLGEVKSTSIRQGFEIALLALIALLVLAQNNLKYLIATDPVPNLIIPVWAVVAYLVVALTPAKPISGRPL